MFKSITALAAVAAIALTGCSMQSESGPDMTGVGEYGQQIVKTDDDLTTYEWWAELHHVLALQGKLVDQCVFYGEKTQAERDAWFEKAVLEGENPYAAQAAAIDACFEYAYPE